MNQPLALRGAAALTHLGLMRARGADAASFLHGQLTNDVQHLQAHRARLAGFCSAKGRLQASFVVWRSTEEDIFLACSASVLAATMKRMSMFVLRAKCRLSDAGADFEWVGLVGASASSRIGETPVWAWLDTPEGQLMRLPDVEGLARAWLLRPRDAAAPLPEPAIDLDVWRWLEVRSGLPTIESATVDQFVPQMLNLELIGGVDFKKGCYPGQEVVARSQYRGTVKRRMFLFDSDAQATAGQEVFTDADPSQPAGMVVNAAARPDGAGSSLLVEIKLAALDAGAVHLHAADGPPIHRAELPYAVPREAHESV